MQCTMMVYASAEIIVSTFAEIFIKFGQKNFDRCVAMAEKGTIIEGI